MFPKSRCQTLGMLSWNHPIHRDKDFIIDDESYFTLSGANQPENDHFYSDNLDVTPESVKYNEVAKYPQKVLVWLAISPRGCTAPFFKKGTGLAINQVSYLEILKTHLIPFIRRKYRGGGYVFWPDLASSHYASSVQNYLKEAKVPVVPKNMNPANLPQVRPIEDFWANLKAEVYRDDWRARNLEELEIRIKDCLRKLGLKVARTHALAVKKRLNQVKYKGV